MKASHPLSRPFFRFFLWQERLSRGWRIALTVGPLLLVRALIPVAHHHPLVLVLIVPWLVFVVVTWLSVPIANAALRLSAVGRAVLPADEKRSSTASLACIGAAVIAGVLAAVVSVGFLLTAFATLLLALSVGSAHSLSPRRRRIVYVGAIAAGVAAFVGGALINVRVGGGSLGAAIGIAALITAGALVWVVRLS
jgi:hypothetical protein